jgi:ParB family transcriptional regulator, chromosome partitioning protein
MPPRKKKVQEAVGLDAREVAAGGAPPDEVRELAEAVADDGGAVLATYRDPFGGKWLLLASLPIDKVEPTPYQRELSDTHAKRLAGVIPKVGQFLDPVIAMRHDDGWWTPNGMHRLIAMRRLGARSIICLLVPDEKVAYRILALNTEKAHTLKDKALEVVRMARGLADAPDTAKKPESDWAFEFEEPAYLTIGLCYEERPRFAGGAYQPIMRRCDEFSDRPIAKSLGDRAERAKRLLELDDLVNSIVEKLKAAGLKSAYLKPFVVARLNPLRWQKAARPGQKAPRADFDATMDKMIGSGKKFDASKVRPQDLASMAGSGPPPAED